MEESNKIFRFRLIDGQYFEGPVLSRFQNITNLEQIKTETMDSDFVTTVNQYGRRVLLSKNQIMYVEEV